MTGDPLAWLRFRSAGRGWANESSKVELRDGGYRLHVAERSLHPKEFTVPRYPTVFHKRRCFPRPKTTNNRLWVLLTNDSDVGQVTLYKISVQRRSHACELVLHKHQIILFPSLSLSRLDVAYYYKQLKRDQVRRT